ncbi:MAG: trypsin-like serine protease [Chloroflexi bacterium]|nr:trypsin-like serine protease [Chloroflexota bacterium]
MKNQTTKTLSVMPVLALAVLALACDSSEPVNETMANAAEPDSAFLETVEATTNEAVGVIDASQSDHQGGISTFDETPILASDTLVFTPDLNIDGMPAKDIEILAKDAIIDVRESPDDVVARELVAWESRLMDIWDSSINGVVLISLENTVFPADGTGAGWFWDDEGHIVTNYHVVRPTSVLGAPRLGSTNKIFVETFEGDRYEAEIIGGDHVSDIAVIKIDADPDTFDTLPLGDSADLRPGMATVALGHPFGIGQSFSMTQGIVSGLARSIQSEASTIPIPSVIQTDADMNPGNSGGPLLNSVGEVVGVNTQIRSISNTNSGVGFATPINLVRRVVDSLIDDGVHEYSFLGISSWTLTPALTERFELDGGQRGLLVTLVSPDGPAHEAGIISDSGSARQLIGDGDIIVRIDNVTIENLYDLRSYIMLNTSPGDEIVVEVLRDGAIVPVSLTLGSWGDRFN